MIRINKNFEIEDITIAANDDYELVAPEVASDVIFTHHIEVDDK